MKRWALEFRDRARDDLRKLDRQVAHRILRDLRDRVCTSDNPRSLGKPLSGQMRDLWRYRVGDYRIICSIENHVLKVLVIRNGHRSDVH